MKNNQKVPIFSFNLLRKLALIYIKYKLIFFFLKQRRISSRIISLYFNIGGGNTFMNLPNIDNISAVNAVEQCISQLRITVMGSIENIN